MPLHFYKQIETPIKAISFDLDDTLYVNDEVIRQAERAQFDVLSQHLPSVQEAGITPWLSLKWQVLNENPSLKHDVTEWRRAVIAHGLKAHTQDKELTNRLVDEAFSAFYQARSNFSIEPSVFAVLKQLSSRYPLVAITNGNVDIHRLGLTPYFVSYYRAGENGLRMKPYPDMLKAACRELDIKESELLHIGDNLLTDIKGAQNTGSPHLWFNPEHVELTGKASLPTGEYSDLEELLQLL